MHTPEDGMPSKMSLRDELKKAGQTYQAQPTAENLTAVHKAAVKLAIHHPEHSAEAVALLKEFSTFQANGPNS